MRVFFNDTGTTEIYTCSRTLSLRAGLLIVRARHLPVRARHLRVRARPAAAAAAARAACARDLMPAVSCSCSARNQQS
eukprot:SAG11_NODE_33797_length_275_cov_0.863636_1_plen_77_part_10